MISDLKIYVIAAAVSSAVSTPASALAGTTATLRCSAVILVGLAASALAGIASTRCVLRATAAICS